MAAVPAFAYHGYFPVAGASRTETTPPAEPSARLRKSLDALFPDLLVQGTRNCLLSMTSSLTKVSGQAHQYFARVSQVLAFERMMRSFMQMAAAVSPFPMDAFAANAWATMFGAAPQAQFPWPHLQPAQPRKPSLASFFGQAFQPQGGSHGQAQPWSDYHSLFVVPLAFLVAAPAPEQWWNFSL